METAGDKDKHFVTLNIYEIAVQTAKEKRLGVKISFKDKSYSVDAPDKIVTKNWNRLRFAFAVTVEDLTQGHVQIEVVEKGAAMFGKDRVVGEAHVPVNQLLKRHARSDKDSAQVAPETILVFNSKEKDAAKASVDLWCEAYGWQHMLLLLQNPDSRAQALTDMERMTTRPKKKDIRQSLTDAGDTKVAVYMVQAFYEEIMSMLEEVISNPTLPWRQQMFDTFAALCAENRTRQKMIEFGILASFRRFLRDQIELKSPGGSSKASSKKPKSPRVSEQAAQNDNECKLLVLKCLKHFFSSAGVQRQIIREKMLDVLIKKLSNETPEKVLLTTFEVLRYFDHAHIEQMLERDILKKLKAVATNDSPSVQSEVLEMIKFFGLGYKDVLEEEKIPKHIRKLIHSTDTNVKLKALDVFQKFKFPEPDEQNAVQNMGALVGSFDPDGNPLMKIKILDKLQSEIQKDEESEKLIAEKTDILKLLTRCLVDISTVVRDKASAMISSFKVVTKKQLVDAGILLTWKEMILNKKLQSEYRDKTVQALADYFRDIGPEVEQAGLIPVVADVIGDDSFSMDTRFVAVDVIEKLEDRLFWSAAHDAGVLAKIVSWATLDTWAVRNQQSSLLYRCLMWVIRALNIQLKQEDESKKAEILATYKERFDALMVKMVSLGINVNGYDGLRTFLEKFLPLFRHYFEQRDFIEHALQMIANLPRISVIPLWTELGGPLLWTDMIAQWNDNPMVNTIISQVSDFLADILCAKIEGSQFYRWPWPEELLDRLLVLTVPRSPASTEDVASTETEAKPEKTDAPIAETPSATPALSIVILPGDEAARVSLQTYHSDHERTRKCQVLWKRMFRHNCVRKFLDLGGLTVLSRTMTDSTKAHDIRSTSGELLSVMVRDPEVLPTVMKERSLYGCLISYIDLLAWNQSGSFLTIIRQLLNDKQNFKDFCSRNAILKITTHINNSQWDRTQAGRSLRAACIDIVAFYVHHANESVKTLMDNASAMAALSTYLGMEEETANFDACASVFWNLTQRSDWVSKSQMWNNYIFYRFDELCRNRAQFKKQFSLGFLLMCRAAAQVIKETGRSTPSNDLSPAIAVLSAYHPYLPATDTAIFCEKRKASRPPAPVLPEPTEAKAENAENVPSSTDSSSTSAPLPSSSSRKTLKKEKGKQKDEEASPATTVTVDLAIPTSETTAPADVAAPATLSSSATAAEQEEGLVASLISGIETLDLSQYASATATANASSSSSQSITREELVAAIDDIATGSTLPPPPAPPVPKVDVTIVSARPQRRHSDLRMRKSGAKSKAVFTNIPSTRNLRRSYGSSKSASSASGSGSGSEVETESDSETMSLSHSTDVQAYAYPSSDSESASDDVDIFPNGTFGSTGGPDVNNTEFIQIMNPETATAPNVNLASQLEKFVETPLFTSGHGWAVLEMLPWFPQDVPSTITVGEFATQTFIAILDFLSALDFKSFPSYSMTTFTQALTRITVKTSTTFKPSPPVQGRMLSLIASIWPFVPAAEKPKVTDVAALFAKRLLDFSDEPSELNASIRVCSFISQGSTLLTDFTNKKEFRDTIATSLQAAESDLEASIALCKMLVSIRSVVTKGVAEDSNRAVKITLKKHGTVGRAVSAALQLVQLTITSNLDSLKADKELFSLILTATTKSVAGVDNELILNVLRTLAGNLGENMSDEDFSSLVLSLWKRISPGSQSNTMKEASGFLVHMLHVDPGRLMPILSGFNFWEDLSKLFGGAQHIYLIPIMSLMVSKSPEFAEKLVDESLKSRNVEANLFVRVMCVIAGSLPEGKARSVVATPEVLAKVAEYMALTRQVSIAGALDGMEWAYLVADLIVPNSKDAKKNTDWTVIKDRLQSSIATWNFHQYCFYFKVFNQKIRAVPAVDPWEEPRSVVRIGKYTSNMLVDRDLCIFGNNQPSLQSAIGNSSVPMSGGAVYFQVYTRILPSWCSLQVGWAPQSAFDTFSPLDFVGVGQAKQTYSFDVLNNRVWKEGTMLPAPGNIGKFYQGHVVSCYLDANRRTIGIKTSTTELVDLITDVDLTEPLFPCVSIDSDANIFFKFDLTPTWFGGVKYSPIT